jgi:hypothetical protein
MRIDLADRQRRRVIEQNLLQPQFALLAIHAGGEGHALEER